MIDVLLQQERAHKTPSSKGEPPALPAQESESLVGTLSRCRSVMTDFGTEHKIWTLPSELISQQMPAWDTLFGLALPVPDADHALHHVSWLRHPLTPHPLRNTSIDRLGGQ